MAAFFDFETTEGHANAASAAGEGVGLTAGLAVVDGLSAAELKDAAMPEGGVLPLGRCEVAKDLGANGVSVALGKGEVGVVGFDLGLPVCFESLKDLFEFRGTEDSGGQLGAPGWWCRYLYCVGYIYEDKACLARVEDELGRGWGWKSWGG